MTDDMSTAPERADRPDWWTEEHEQAALEGLAENPAVQAHEATKHDPVNVAEDFSESIDPRSMTGGAELGRWLVAEARYQRDVALRDALYQNDSYANAMRTIDAYRLANTDLALQLRMAHAGATPDYVHDERMTITHPGDFLAWLFSLDAADRVKTAERVLRQADEAGACFFEDHRGRIASLENHAELLQARITQRAGERLRRPEQLGALSIGGMIKDSETSAHPCGEGRDLACVWDSSTGLHQDGTPCLNASRGTRRSSDQVSEGT